ncbi:hypothetical protein C0583_05785 [Candidatus Parcubacteria bacterium]|nr:MAG: hypothetical protein C0583_05785 [Candidatus Parcubacteria bacterium]
MSYKNLFNDPFNPRFDPTLGKKPDPYIKEIDNPKSPFNQKNVFYCGEPGCPGHTNGSKCPKIGFFCSEPGCKGVHFSPKDKCPPIITFCETVGCKGHINPWEKCNPLPYKCPANNCPGHANPNRMCLSMYCVEEEYVILNDCGHENCPGHEDSNETCIGLILEAILKGDYKFPK